MSREEYERAMLEAEECEQFIARYQVNDDVPTGTLGEVKNFAANATDNQFKVTQCYKHALEVYTKFNKPEKVLDLLNSLFWLVDTSSFGTLTFAIHLLLSLSDVVEYIEVIRSGTKQEIKQRLQNLIFSKLHEHDRDFWLIRNTLPLIKILEAGDVSEQNKVDEFLCNLLPLVAHNSIVIGNLSNAISCYTEASKIAENLGDTRLSQEFLQQASYLTIKLHNMPPRPGSIEEDLNKVIMSFEMKISDEQFIVTFEEVQKEYALVVNKLEALIKDQRFFLNDDVINEIRVKYYAEDNLSKWIPARDIDQYGNIRSLFREGDDNITRQLEINYTLQIVNMIGSLFSTWQENHQLTKEQILSLISSSNLTDYDWQIFQHGLNRHFEKDYVSSVHTLIPQLENIIRTCAEKASIAVKKPNKRTKGIIWGQKLLNDLLYDKDIRAYLGDNFAKVLSLYFVNEPFAYRHKIAHGFISPEQCNITVSAMIIWAMLVTITKPFPTTEVV